MQRIKTMICLLLSVALLLGVMLLTTLVSKVKRQHSYESGTTSTEQLSVAPYYEQCCQPVVVTGENFPKLNMGNPDVREYYSVGFTAPGIVYSSTFRDGTDVLWNLNISTYYSAVANPASVLYTQNNWGRVSNEAAYYGSVCSTTALKCCGYKYPYTTAEVAKAMQEKTDHTIENIDVGDILWRKGHVAGLVGVTADANGHVVSVKIVEQNIPYAQTFEVSAESWDSYFSSHWETIYYSDERTEELPKAYPENKSIIFSRGNNTYVTDYEQMLFYIPTANQIWLTKDGVTTEYSKFSFGTKVVNNTLVYDLSDLFDGVGDYFFHTEENTTDICIKVIEMGSITLDENAAALSGYDNCRPVCYRVIGLVSGQGTYDFWHAPEGYSGSAVSNSYEDIKSDAFAIENLPSTNKFMLEVFYDTGYGWARKISEAFVGNPETVPTCTQQGYTSSTCA